MSTDGYRGSCLCGIVRYTIKRFQPTVGHCHCTMCRKFHGAAYSTYGEVLLTDFEWTAGENQLTTYRAENATLRQFCRHCGSSLTFQSPQYQSKEIEVSLATLDDPVDLKPNAHIYVNFMASWNSITDHLPQYGEYRDGPILTTTDASQET